MDSYKIAICLIIKDENEYLEEWLNHHRAYGFNHFIIMDNNSVVPVSQYLFEQGIEVNDITTLLWTDNKHGSQLRAYRHCCKLYSGVFDFILFIDTDEFYESINENVHKDIDDIERYRCGLFNGLGIYWRMYGGITEERRPIVEYRKWHENPHLKSIVRPETIIKFPDPHYAILSKGNLSKAKYVNEKGFDISSPTGHHTSEHIWIKHTWTRSLPEYREKLKRGSGDKVVRNYNEQHFWDYNNACKLH